MKHFPLFVIVITMMLSAACNKATLGNHVGEKAISITELEIDSIVIDADSTSIRGSFHLVDTSLLFVDRLYCKVFPFSLRDGCPGNPFGGYGQGPNEMVGVMCASMISDSTMWIVDTSNGIYECNPRTGQIEYLKRLDFSWDKLKRNNYESPSVYNIMEVTSYGIKIVDLGNDSILIPISLINRHLDGVTLERYEKGHIFGVLDKDSLKISKLYGLQPEWYKDNPLPMFDFFDYEMDWKDSLVYVNHTPDSLIYCYRYPDELLYTFGYEPKGMHRDFKIGYDYKFEDFKSEIRKASTNTGLYYDPIDDMLFRTSITDYESGNAVLQIYHDKNLIGEVSVPPFFKMLGRVCDRYYAVRLTPLETDDGGVYFLLYNFVL